jgi:GT2 family glycosyltransferase
MVNRPSKPQRRTAVVLASAGRPNLLRDRLLDLGDQTLKPVQIVVSVPDLTSFPPGLKDIAGVPIDLVSGNRGLAVQRNAAIAAVRDDVEFVGFFDDDAVLRDDYLERSSSVLATSGAVGLTGRVVVDGAAEGREAPLEEALEALRRSRFHDLPETTATTELYGCNFVVARSVLDSHHFDERLRLYSWLEDLDFSKRVASSGALVRDGGSVIAHLGSASGGRTQHVRLGYSQVTNPVYLWRKKSISITHAAGLVIRPVGRNLIEAATGPSSEWRRNRLRGNIMSIADLVRGRVTPERIEEIR